MSAFFFFFFSREKRPVFFFLNNHFQEPRVFTMGAMVIPYRLYSDRYSYRLYMDMGISYRLQWGGKLQNCLLKGGEVTACRGPLLEGGGEVTA